jgi:hypothetical protein
MDNEGNRKKLRVGQEYGKDNKRLERVKQFLSEKSDEELSEMVKQKSIFPEYVKYYAIQELKKRKDERERRFKKDIETANEILMGRRRICRLSPEEEKGRIAGGRRNVEASVILGAGRGTNEKNESKQRFRATAAEQENCLREYAKSVDIWIQYDDIFFTCQKGFMADKI